MSDLEEQSTQSSQVPDRRRRFFESSAGLLRNDSEAGEFRRESFANHEFTSAMTATARFFRSGRSSGRRGGRRVQFLLACGQN